jgi:hypothetical protein
VCVCVSCVRVFFLREFMYVPLQVVGGTARTPEPSAHSPRLASSPITAAAAGGSGKGAMTEKGRAAAGAAAWPAGTLRRPSDVRRPSDSRRISYSELPSLGRGTPLRDESGAGEGEEEEVVVEKFLRPPPDFGDRPAAGDGSGGHGRGTGTGGGGGGGGGGGSAPPPPAVLAEATPGHTPSGPAAAAGAGLAGRSGGGSGGAGAGGGSVNSSSVRDGSGSGTGSGVAALESVPLKPNLAFKLEDFEVLVTIGAPQWRFCVVSIDLSVLVSLCSSVCLSKFVLPSVCMCVYLCVRVCVCVIAHACVLMFVLVCDVREGGVARSFWGLCRHGNIWARAARAPPGDGQALCAENFEEDGGERADGAATAAIAAAAAAAAADASAATIDVAAAHNSPMALGLRLCCGNLGIRGCRFYV